MVTKNSNNVCQTSKRKMESNCIAMGLVVSLTLFYLHTFARFENCALTFHMFKTQHNDFYTKKTKSKKMYVEKSIRNFWYVFICACYVFDMWKSTILLVIPCCVGAFNNIHILVSSGILRCDQCRKGESYIPSYTFNSIFTEANTCFWDVKGSKLYVVFRRVNRMLCDGDKRSILHLGWQ